jgi:hypothetical protein
METEHDRLSRLYAELGDEHLKDLADSPEDLTDEARFALQHEMQRRGFTAEPAPDPAAEPEHTPERESGFGAGIPGIFPSGAATVEQALEPGGETRLGWVGLVSFYDGLELSRACAALEDSDTDFAIEEKAGDAMSGAPNSFEIWVRAADVDLSQRVLREKLGLFPHAEIQDSATTEDAAPLTVGNFESSEEANEVYHRLREQGLTPILTEPTAEDEDFWWTIEVPANEHDRALAIVAAGLGLTSQL